MEFLVIVFLFAAIYGIIRLLSDSSVSEQRSHEYFTKARAGVPSSSSKLITPHELARRLGIDLSSDHLAALAEEEAKLGASPLAGGYLSIPAYNFLNRQMLFHALFSVGARELHTGNLHISQKSFDGACNVIDWPTARFGMAICLYEQQQYEMANTAFKQVSLSAHKRQERLAKQCESLSDAIVDQMSVTLDTHATFLGFRDVSALVNVSHDLVEMNHVFTQLRKGLFELFESWLTNCSKACSTITSSNPQQLEQNARRLGAKTAITALQMHFVILAVASNEYVPKEKGIRFSNALSTCLGCHTDPELMSVFYDIGGKGIQGPDLVLRMMSISSMVAKMFIGYESAEQFKRITQESVMDYVDPIMEYSTPLLQDSIAVVSKAFGDE